MAEFRAISLLGHVQGRPDIATDQKYGLFEEQFLKQVSPPTSNF